MPCSRTEPHALVVLDREVVGEAAEDAPAAVVARATAAHGDEWRHGDADAGAGPSFDVEAVEHDPGGVLDVDAVGRARVVRGDARRRALRDEGDRASRRPRGAEIEALVVAVFHVDRVAGTDGAGGMHQARPRAGGRRAGGRVVAPRPHPELRAPGGGADEKHQCEHERGPHGGGLCHSRCRAGKRHSIEP